MKNKTIFGVISVLVIIGLFGGWKARHAYAVSETCTGVATEFLATYPASVVAGQPITLSDINTTPATSFAVTIKSSTLNLSATGATPAVYSNKIEPPVPVLMTTNPAFYSNWSLTATGAAGSQVIVKLTSVTVDTVEYGPFTCQLTSTLATINITAPPPTPVVDNSAPPTTPAPPSNAEKEPTTSPNPQNDKKPTDTQKPEEPAKVTEIKEEPAKEEQIKASALTITVKYKNGKALKGAAVTIDNQLTVETSKDGTATFDGIRIGDHQISISYGGQKIEQTIQVKPVNDDNRVTIIFPTKSYLLHMIIAGILGVLAVAAAFFIIDKRTGSRVYNGLRSLRSPTKTVDTATSTSNNSPTTIDSQAYSPVVIKPQGLSSETTVNVSPVTVQHPPYSRDR